MTDSLFLNTFGPWALVTGASSGIGEGFAYELASKGINLVLVARRVDLLEKTGAALHAKFGIQYRVAQVDIFRPQASEVIIECCEDLDIGLLISNAGTGRPGRFINRSEQDLSEIIQVNALSHIWLTYYFGRKFAAKGKGGIVLTGAMGSTNGVPFMAIESGTKSFLEGFGKSLNYELKDKCVHVTVLVTPPTQTPVLRNLGFNDQNMPTSPVTVKQCVTKTLDALTRNKAWVLPGRKFRIMNSLMPPGLNRQIMGNTMKKINNIQ
jgi:short-subunit dehydrogenase